MNTKKKSDTIDKPAKPVPLQRHHPNSRANVVAELAVGQSYSESRRLVFDETKKLDVEEARADLKNILTKVASLAATRSGHKYTTESGEFFTRSGDIIVSVVVTRIG